MPDGTSHPDELHDVAALWWVTLALGLLSLVAGIIVLIKPGHSLTAIAIITGIFVLVDGIVALIAAITGNTESRALASILGVVSLVVGVLLIRHPVGGVTAVAMLVGLWMIAMGAVRFVLAFGAPQHRVWRVAVGIIELIAGIAIVSSPKIGLAALALFVGISLIANGVTLTALGVALRGIGRGSGASAPRTPAAAH